MQPQILAPQYLSTDGAPSCLGVLLLEGLQEKSRQTKRPRSAVPMVLERAGLRGWLCRRTAEGVPPPTQTHSGAHEPQSGRL